MDAFSGKETGEHALLRKILDIFKAGDVALADTYYLSYFLICELIKKGVDFVSPAHTARDRDFRTGKRLGKKDHVAAWKKPAKPEWMEQEAYDAITDTLNIREVEILSKRKGFRDEKRTLVTSFLDPIDVSKEHLSLLYDFRWYVELDIRSIKSVMKMDILRPKTPEMMDKEIWSRLLAYNIVRKIMLDAAIRSDTIPRHLSFKVALRAVDSFRQLGLLSNKNTEGYFALLEAIAHKKVGNRPGRHEPRLIKRRPKPQKRMQKLRSFYKNASHAGVA